VYQYANKHRVRVFMNRFYHFLPCLSGRAVPSGNTSVVPGTFISTAPAAQCRQATPWLPRILLCPSLQALWY
jgi:hypothetical protein